MKRYPLSLFLLLTFAVASRRLRFSNVVPVDIARIFNWRRRASARVANGDELRSISICGAVASWNPGAGMAAGAG